MTGTRPADILRHLEPAGPDDRALLTRYAAQNDQAAFAELVRRHGPLVWAACRRVAGHSQDAEDAFQAAFLVLVRRAAAVRNPDLLGNWLYGVAVRVAMKARRSAVRRRKREVQVHAMPDPPAVPASGDAAEVLPIIDEELAALPEWYREAVVLCDLRGASREEAARALGIPEGTLSSRLAAGRKKLASRLAKRGVALSATAVPGALGDAARASVPVGLVAKVHELAGGAAVPAAVARLAAGGYSVKTVLFLGLFCAAAVGAVYASQPTDPPRPADLPQPPPVAKAVPAPDAKPDPKPDAKAGDGPAFTSKPVLKFARDVAVNYPASLAWSPDGKSIVVSGPSPTADSKSRRVAVVLSGVLDPPTRTFDQQSLTLDRAGTVARLMPDGKSMLTDAREYSLLSGRHELKLQVPDSNIAHGWRPVARVALENTEAYGYAFAADGKTFRTVAYTRGADGVLKQFEILEVDVATGKTLRPLLKMDYAGEPVLSPRGNRVALFEKKKTARVYDVDTGKLLATATIPDFVPPPPNDKKSFGGPNIGDNPIVYSSFSEDGSRLVIARGLGATIVLNTDTGETLPPLEGLEMCRTIPTPQCFSGDGRLLVLGAVNYVAQKVTDTSGRERGVFSVANHSLTVWDLKTGKVLKAWGGTATAALHPTRPVLAILERNEEECRLGLWDFAADPAKK